MLFPLTQSGERAHALLDASIDGVADRTAAATTMTAGHTWQAIGCIQTWQSVAVGHHRVGN